MGDEIVPVSRSLFLCDAHIGYRDGKVDLYGILNADRAVSYPHVLRRLVVFAQLANGLGDVPFFFEIRRDSDDELVRVTAERTLRFADRMVAIQAVMTIEDVVFEEPGVYTSFRSSVTINGSATRHFYWNDTGERHARQAPTTLKHVVR